MPLGDYLEGLVFFAGTVGAVGLGAWLVVRRRLPGLGGAARALAFAVIAVAGLIGVHLVPGLLGILSRESALASALALVAILWRFVRPGAPPEETPPVGSEPAAGREDAQRGAPIDPISAAEAPPPPTEQSTPPSWALALLAAGAAALWALANLWQELGQPATDIDSLTFHLPNIARWIQEGSFWRVDNFNPLLANGNYPNNGDVVVLSTVLPWENDAFAKLMGLPLVAVTACAVYAIATELRAPRATAVLLAAAFTAIPVVGLNAYRGALTDPVMWATFGSGVYFLLRHRRTGARSDLILAGIGLGIAFGTKWYGIWSVAVVLAVWGVASLAGGRRARTVLAQGTALIALVGVAGGFWLVRNLVETGNPVFPVKVGLLGTTVFDAPHDPIRECAGFTIAGYLGSPGIWADFILPAYRDNYGLPGLLLLAGLLLGTALALRRRVGRVLTLAAAALLLAVAYSLTPYSAFGAEGEPTLVGANARWLGPALLCAAAVAAWGIGRLGRLRPVGELIALVALADGLRRGFEIEPSLVVKAGLAIALAAGIGLVGVTAAQRLPLRGRLVAGAVAATLALTTAAAVGHERQRTYNETRYANAEAPIAWIVRNAPEGHRIGLAGVWGTETLSPVLPAFGPRLGNEVSFVGEYVRGQLREIESRERWLAAIRRGGYDLLMVGRGGYSDRCPVPGESSDDDAWARGAGFQVLATGRRLTLYRVSPAKT